MQEWFYNLSRGKNVKDGNVSVINQIQEEIGKSKELLKFVQEVKV